jgi:hypothetical protein
MSGSASGSSAAGSASVAANLPECP